MIRLAVARLWFCSNSFNPRRTRLEDLRRHEWTDGQAAFVHPRAPGSDIDGLAAFLSARPDWDVAMLRCAAAPPGGPLGGEVLTAWLSDVEPAVRSGRFDALYVSLHGACQAEGDPSADTTVLRRLRQAARRLPIVASFDCRANISDEMPLLLDGASAARGPGDGAAAARRALTMLEGILAGRIRPIGAVARLPMAIPPAHLRRVMESLWRDEFAQVCGGNQTSLLDASVFSGFAWSDTVAARPSALTWADRDAGAARDAASLLVRRLQRGREPYTIPPLSSARETLARAAMSGRTLVLDTADDPDAGSLGDTPDLLRTVLETAFAPSAVAVLADPRAVAAAHAAGAGAAFGHPFGACLTPRYGKPVLAQVRVLRLLPGMAVLRAGSVSILVADRPTPAEPALLEAAGIDLGGLRVLAVKGADAARVAFARLFPLAIPVSCPGPAGNDLACPSTGRRGRQA